MKSSSPLGTGLTSIRFYRAPTQPSFTADVFQMHAFSNWQFTHFALNTIPHEEHHRETRCGKLETVRRSAMMDWTDIAMKSIG